MLLTFHITTKTKTLNTKIQTMNENSLTTDTDRKAAQQQDYGKDVHASLGKQSKDKQSINKLI